MTTGHEQTLHKLLKLNHRLLAPFSAHFEQQFNITVNQFRVLMMVGRLGATASHEIVELTAANPMSVSRSVAELKKSGRLNVASDPNNGRRKTLTLTAEGQKLYEAMLPATAKVMAYLFKDLREDEIMAFDRYVTTLIKTLEETGENGELRFIEYTRP